MRIFEDTKSRSADRPGLRDALAHLRAGDTLVIWRLDWMGRSLETCLKDGIAPDSVITPQAQDFLVERLSTPFQIAEHLNRVFTDAFNLGAEKVSREIVENTLSAGFDSLHARLARIGYTPKALAERFDAHPTEARRFLIERLDPERTAELGAALLNTGIPTRGTSFAANVSKHR